MSKTKAMGWKMLSITALVALSLTSVPVLAQDADDEDDRPAGVIILVFSLGSSVSESDLKAKIQQSLDQKKVRYSDAQLQSLAKQSATKLKSMKGAKGQFKVCAEAKGPCVKIVRQ